MTGSHRSTKLLRLLTITDVATALAVSPRTIRRLIEGGTLRVTRIGRQVRVHPADLDDYLSVSRRDNHLRSVMASHG